MVKYILFDLGNTLIKNEGLDFKGILDDIFEHIININISKNRFKVIARNIFEKLYKTRDIDLIEIKFTDYLTKLKKELNIEFNMKIDEFEVYLYQNHITDSKIEKAINFLDYCKNNNIKMYLFSNSTFSMNALKYTLKLFKLDEYFVECFSSSDVIFRKPSSSFFSKTSIEDKIKKEHTIYIGNDNYIDGNFAKNIGIRFFWYNEFNKDDNLKIATFIFNNYLDLQTYLEKENGK